MYILLFIIGYIVGNISCGIALYFYATRKAKNNKKALEGLKMFLEVKQNENKENH